MPAPAQEEEFEEDDLEEVELVALAFDITVDELPRGVKTGADLCKVVEEIIRKAAPGIPSEKDLEELGVAEEALLVVASTDDDSDPFSAEDDVRFPTACTTAVSATRLSDLRRRRVQTRTAGGRAPFVPQNSRVSNARVTTRAFACIDTHSSSATLC